MMLFGWDIDAFVLQILPPQKRSGSMVSWVKVLLKNTKNLYADLLLYRSYLLKKMRYNGQTIVLENLLNDTFDNTLRRIKIITVYDIITPVFLAQPVENAPLYVGQPTEPPPVYVGQPSEYGVNYDFIVIVPNGSLTTLEEIRLKALTNYYKLAGKKPQFQYQNGTIF